MTDMEPINNQAAQREHHQCDGNERPPVFSVWTISSFCFRVHLRNQFYTRPVDEQKGWNFRVMAAAARHRFRLWPIGGLAGFLVIPAKVLVGAQAPGLLQFGLHGFGKIEVGGSHAKGVDINRPLPVITVQMVV